MSKKDIITLTAVLLAVAAVFLYLYGDSFKTPGIHIVHTFRPRLRVARGQAQAGLLNNLNFAFDRDYKLTCIKVIPVSELATNKFAHPVWELDSESNSPPTRTFSYGSHIRGMHPAVKGAIPDVLEANVPYRMLVEAGTLKGAHDFSVPSDDSTAP